MMMAKQWILCACDSTQLFKAAAEKGCKGARPRDPCTPLSESQSWAMADALRRRRPVSTKSGLSGQWDGLVLGDTQFNPNYSSLQPYNFIR